MASLIPSADPLAATKRRAGPAVRDAERTRALLLEAAAEEFARSGLGGARVERIAEQAGVNVRMLYYYFQSKDELFLAVLESMYTVIRASEQALELDDIDPVEGVRRLVAFTWQFQTSRPEFITLLNSENLHQGVHVAKSSFVAGLHSPMLSMIQRVLERGARSGVFRCGVDPMQFYITIAALGYFFISNQYTLSAIFVRDLMAPEERAARLAHMIEVVLGYLRPVDNGDPA
jgi:AcrR family transcriptional regulator